MANVTDQILAEAIESLPDVFDSHAVIRKVMTRSSPAIRRRLRVPLAGSDPILIFHASIGSRLAAFGSIMKTKKVLSTNVRGQETENQQWRKKT